MAILPLLTSFNKSIFLSPVATCSYLNPVNAGDFLIVKILGVGGPSTVTISDNLGNAYSLLVSYFGSAEGPIWVYMAKVTHPGTCTVTVTPDAGWVQIYAEEWYSSTGADLVLDSYATHTEGSFFAADVGITTSNYGCQIMAATNISERCSDTNTISFPTGWTITQEMQPGDALPTFRFYTFDFTASGDISVGAAGTYTWSWQPTTCAVWDLLLFAMAEAAPPITADCSSLTTGVTGTKYTGYLTFTGGIGPYCVLPVDPDTNPLPPGLMFTISPTRVVGFDSVTGKPIYAVDFFGVPVKPGTYTFTLNITDLGHTPTPTWICVTCSITVTGTDLSCPCGPVAGLDLIVDYCYSQPPTGEPDGVIQYGFPAMCNVWFSCLYGAPMNTDVANGFTNAVGCQYEGVGCSTLIRSGGGGSCIGACVGMEGWSGEADCNLLTWYTDPTSPVYHDLATLINTLSVGMTNGGNLFWDVPLDERSNCTCDVIAISALYLIVRFFNGSVFILFPGMIHEWAGSNGGRTPSTSSDPSSPVSGAGGGTSASSGGTGITTSSGGTVKWTSTANCSTYNHNCPESLNQWARQCHKNGPTAPAQVWYSGFVGTAAKPCPSSDCLMEASCLTAHCNGPSIAYRDKEYNGGVLAFGGTPTYTYAKTSGSFPPGLSMDPATGIISGTPTKAGVFQFEVTVTDSAMPTHATYVQRCGITVNAGNAHF